MNKQMKLIFIFALIITIILLLGTGELISARRPRRTYECSDRVDNDGDGFCDYRGCYVRIGRTRVWLSPDPDCNSYRDNSEVSTCVPSNEVCNDNIDNDCDGLTDCNDLDCENDNFCFSYPEGLVAYWKFENNLIDSSGNGFDGTNNRAIYTPDGKNGGGYEFSSELEPLNHTYIRITHDHYYTPNELDFVEKSEISYFGWFKSNKNLSDLGSEWDSYVIFKPKYSFLLGWSGWSHDGWECNIWNQSNANQRVAVWNTKPLVSDEWVHVGCVFDGSSLGLYINGILVAYQDNIDNYKLQVDTGGYPNEYYDLFIGAKNQFPATGLTWDGVIDEVMIYNQALTTSEVQEIYNAQNI
jgi:hypothetical protein